MSNYDLIAGIITFVLCILASETRWAKKHYIATGILSITVGVIASQFIEIICS